MILNIAIAVYIYGCRSFSRRGAVGACRATETAAKIGKLIAPQIVGDNTIHCHSNLHCDLSLLSGMSAKRTVPYGHIALG